MKAILAERFAATHTVEIVGVCPRTVPAELLEFLAPAEAESAVREYRDPQEWALYTPRNGGR